MPTMAATIIIEWPSMHATFVVVNFQLRVCLRVFVSGVYTYENEYLKHTGKIELGK